MKKILSIIGISTMIFACTSSEDLQNTLDENGNFRKVTLTAHPFTFQNSTRTVTNPTSTGMSFGWSENDTIGLFHIAQKEGQVFQALGVSESGNQATATFDGGPWRLRPGNNYAAYYPFQGNMKLNESSEKVPINMVGQEQNGNAKTNHLGKFDYMYALPKACSSQTETVDFEFYHTGAILQINLTMPVAATWNKLTLESTTECFKTKATMNVKTGVVTATEYSNKVDLALKNISSTAGQELTFYVYVLPTATGVVTVSVTDSNNKTYSAALSTSSMSFIAEGAYAFFKSPSLSSDEFDGKDYVDLGTGDGVLWGRYNVNVSGGTSPEYYAWAWTETNSSYTESSYVYWTYCHPFYGGQNQLDPSGDDVAYINLSSEGGHWYIPTATQMNNLISGCNWVWTTMNGKSGYKVSHKTKPSRYIFIPALGTMNENGLVETNCGYYWTANVDTESSEYRNAKCLKISESEKSVTSMSRHYGMTIRPVFIKN